MVDGQAVVDKEGKVLLGTTKAGKQLFYAAKAGKSVRFICFGDGGQLPAMLDGGYSSVRAAQEMVDSYLAKEAAKGKKKAKA